MLRVRQALLDDLQAGTVDAVLAALAQALKLEHATIPPYLYAMYSLDPAKNGEIADLIQSVVVEEMLHMTLVCNIINALGGAPSLDTPDAIPTYPGPLPGGIDEDLRVGLAPFSRDLVKLVFMEIEEPEDPLTFPVRMAALGAPAGPPTIGAFYDAIKTQIVALGDGAFCKQPRNQIAPDLMPEAVVVTDVASAVAAIETIVEQGEGTATSPQEVVGGDYAHYYRFAEVYHGRRLIANEDAGPNAPPDDRFIYAGAPIPFDPTGVYPIPTNPKAAMYVPGNADRRAVDLFNYTYTGMLRSLHRVFNGETAALGAAIGMMFSLRQQAMDMMLGNTTGGERVGPTFEYQLTSP